MGQRALRALALETFQHIHQLSMRYHVTRRTGGLSRIIERGVKGVEFLLRFLLFSIGPLILELLLVSIILLWLFDVWYLVVVAVTIALYIWFTFAVTEWRVKLRREMNDQDTEANQRAIDSLLNFETVKYFNAEMREAERYDVSMKGYATAALKTAYSLAFLNFGQSMLITWRTDRRDGSGRNGRAKWFFDGWRLCDGQRLYDPDYGSIELPWYGVPRDPAVVGGHGPDV